MRSSDIEVILRGLSDANEEKIRSETVKKGYIKELARLIFAEGSETVGELFSADGYGGQPISDSFFSALSVIEEGEDRGIFAKLLTGLYESRIHEVSDTELFPEPDTAAMSAAFVSGSGADAAFDSFAHVFRLSAVHTGRISSACDAVLDGDAGFCILPVVSGRDGRLRSFYRMIDVYGLKISATVTVESSENVMRYALCKLNSRPLSGTPSRIEFSLPTDGNGALAVSAAATALGHSLFEISSFPSERDGDIFSFTFDVRGEYKSFLLYLNLFHPRFTLTGLYNDIT